MTIAQETVDRMVVLIRRMSALPNNPDRSYIEAREINALLPPPADPDQVEVDALLEGLGEGISVPPEVGLRLCKLGRSLERGDEQQARMT
jgi:hypothetical protein